MKLGIDLGTTNTLAAYMENGRPRLIPNSRGRFTTPSVVGLDGGGVLLVGESARNQVLSAPARTIAQVKRSIGRRIALPLGAGSYSPEELSARILQMVRTNAQEYLGDAIEEAVITVPAHFDDRQRAATVEAGLLSGLSRVSLLNEPTAAALPYAERSRNHERIVVFDFGGGTLDVSCLERDGDDYVVHASLGDGELGGTDIDQVLYHRLSEQISTRTDISAEKDPLIAQVLLQAAEHAKIELSDRLQTTVTLPFLNRGPGDPHISFEVTRDEMNAAIAPLIEPARTLTARALNEAGFDRRGFDTLVLSGGSSRLPAVQQFLRDDYGVSPAARVNPEEVVAGGAALYAATGGVAGLHLREALSHTLSIELSDGSCVPVIRKNQSLPASRTRIFTTVADQQVEAEIHLLQGDKRKAADNRSLGQFTLTNIETAGQGRARITVSVSVDEDGLVTLRAGDRATGVQRQMTTRPKSESVRNVIEGDKAMYLDSLRRRIALLAGRARGDLKAEMEQIVQLLEDQQTAVGDDMVTVLETLILEAVAEQGSSPAGDDRAAS